MTGYGIELTEQFVNSIYNTIEWDDEVFDTTNEEIEDYLGSNRCYNLSVVDSGNVYYLFVDSNDGYNELKRLGLNLNEVEWMCV